MPSYKMPKQTRKPNSFAESVQRIRLEMERRERRNDAFFSSDAFQRHIRAGVYHPNIWRQSKSKHYGNKRKQ